MQEENKQAALKFLNVRMRSEFEMRRYLKRKQVEEDEIDEILEYLYHYNYLNDEEFAKSYIRDKLNFSPCGRYKLSYALAEMGINSFVAEDALEELFPEEVEREQLKRAFAKCKRKGKTYEQAVRYLYGKGYGGSMLSDLERY